MVVPDTLRNAAAAGLQQQCAGDAPAHTADPHAAATAPAKQQQQQHTLVLQLE